MDASSQRDELEERLAQAPSAEAAREQLARVARLQQAADAADRGVVGGTGWRRRGRGSGRSGSSGRWRRRGGSCGRRAIRWCGSVRLRSTMLMWLLGGAALLAWVGEHSGRVEGRIESARADAEKLATALRAAEQAVLDELAGAGVEAGVPVRDRAPVAVATAITAARAEHEELARRLAGAKKLAGEIAAAREQSQVAKQLADLMRSNQFPRWLVASALDTLVEEASRSLLELSGGQFELTHENGDFLVIDHNEAGHSAAGEDVVGWGDVPGVAGVGVGVVVAVGGVGGGGGDAVGVDLPR